MPRNGRKKKREKNRIRLTIKYSNYLTSDSFFKPTVNNPKTTTSQSSFSGLNYTPLPWRTKAKLVLHVISEPCRLLLWPPFLSGVICWRQNVINRFLRLFFDAWFFWRRLRHKIDGWMNFLAEKQEVRREAGWLMDGASKGSHNMW